MLKRFVLWEGALASNLVADPKDVFADLVIERCRPVHQDLHWLLMHLQVKSGIVSAFLVRV